MVGGSVVFGRGVYCNIKFAAPPSTFVARGGGVLPSGSVEAVLFTAQAVYVLTLRSLCGIGLGE